MNIRTIAVAAPFINGVLYGLYYALLEQGFQKISMPTMWIMTSVAGLLAVAIMVGMKLAPIDFTPLADKRTLLIILAVQIIGVIISIFFYIAMRHTSATYLAFGELSYPLFVAIFAYVLFSSKELNWTTAIGGALILAGSGVLLLGKSKLLSS